MYKEIRKNLEDKKILEELIKGLNERIKFKIQKELGLHATTYTELKVETSNIIDDKFARVFASIEKLDKRKEKLEEELKIIETTIKKADSSLSKMNDKEKKVFRCRYIWGMPIKSIAERLNYSEVQVKRILKEINKK